MSNTLPIALTRLLDYFFYFFFYCISSDFSDLPDMTYEYIDLSVYGMVYYISNINSV